MRSSLVRRDEKRGMNGWDWQERFDPLTNSVFFYNRQNGRNTWDCPAIFQKHLICTWDGLIGFRSSTTSKLTQFNPDAAASTTDGEGGSTTGSEAVGGSTGTGVEASSTSTSSILKSYLEPKRQVRSTLVVDRVTGKARRVGTTALEETRDPAQKCRCAFSTVEELHQHLQSAHFWYCPACESRNTGLHFPVCRLCSNSLSDVGLDGIDVSGRLM